MFRYDKITDKEAIAKFIMVFIILGMLCGFIFSGCSDSDKTKPKILKQYDVACYSNGVEIFKEIVDVKQLIFYNEGNLWFKYSSDRTIEISGDCVVKRIR